jgi:hypothetical protein
MDSFSICPAMPITSEAGFLINEQGRYLVFSERIIPELCSILAVLIGCTCATSAPKRYEGMNRRKRIKALIIPIIAN